MQHGIHAVASRGCNHPPPWQVLAPLQSLGVLAPLEPRNRLKACCDMISRCLVEDEQGLKF